MAKTTKFAQWAYRKSLEFWVDVRSELERYNDTYLMQYWMAAEEEPDEEDPIRIELADAFVAIESYQSSLFHARTAVEVYAAVTTTGIPKMAQAVANTFLADNDVRTERNDGSRVSLILGEAAYVIQAYEGDRVVPPLSRFSLKSLPPWDVLLDRDAKREKDQRFIGYIEWLPATSFLKRFKGSPRNTKFFPVHRVDFWTMETPDEEDGHLDLVTLFGAPDSQQGGYDPDGDMPLEALWMRVVHFYNLLDNTYGTFSPDWDQGQVWLNKPEPIADFDHKGSPVLPLVRELYKRVPGSKLDGIPTMRRIYDVVSEKIQLRNHWANAIRRTPRILLVNKHLWNGEARDKLEDNKDGAVIPVDDIEVAAKWLQAGNLSADYQIYDNAISVDLEKSHQTAGFTRGQTAGARTTATEIQELAQYTDNEMGQMARERDACTENIAAVYLRLVAAELQDEPEAIEVDDELVVVKAEDVDGPFDIVAEDRASTPVSESNQRQQFLVLLPMLQQMGVPPAALLKVMTKLYQLPVEILDEFIKAAGPAAGTPGDVAPPQTGGNQPPTTQGNGPNAGPSGSAPM